MQFLRTLHQGVKANADRGRKKVLKDERRLKSSRFNSRMIFTIGFWLVVSGVVFFTFQAYVRTGFLNKKVNGYQSEAIAQIESLNEVGFANSPAGEMYSVKFITNYINIPADQNGRAKRAETLQSFLAEGLKVEDLENLDEFKGKRELKSASFYDVKNVTEDSASYVYRIQYEVFKNIEAKEPDGEKAEDQNVNETVGQKEQSVGVKDVMIVVRLGTDGNSFNVIEQPFFQALPSDAHLTAVEDQTDKAKKNVKAENELKQFATQFFTSYTTNSVEEMSYLMEEPETLKDLYQYKGLEDFIVYNSDKEGQYVVKCLVVLQQADTGLESKHPFTLVVSKENHKFYVKEFKHTIGG